MELYKNAEKWRKAARNAASTADYQASVFNSCLAVELYLKSKVKVIDPASELERSHDVIAMYTKLQRTYPSKKELRRVLVDCRKYFNESRYPFGDDSTYTKEFAEQFLQYVDDVKDYIDNECQATLEELQKKYTKDVEPTPSMVEWGRKNKE